MKFGYNSEALKFTSVSYFHIPFNPLTPRSDQHETSPYNILTLSSKQLMRIFKLIR